MILAGVKQNKPSAMGIISTLQGQYSDLAALAIIVVALAILISSLASAFKPGLRSIPGPLFARFSPFYRLVKLSKGDAPVFYRRLHETYGPIVRTGPNTIDISDPKAVPIIYGINSKFLKVRAVLVSKSGSLYNSIPLPVRLL